MVTVLPWAGVVLAILAMLASVLACLLGLPGSAFVLVIAFVLSASTHWQRPPLWVVLIFVGLAALAETGDNLLSAWGTKRYGGSTKGTFWALVGGSAGVLLLGWLGPLVGGIGGPLGCFAGGILAPVAGGLAGGFLGGYWYELLQGAPRRRRAGPAGGRSSVGRRVRC
jgi:uncharacterized protein YqgC (DUF456 family)